MIRIAAIAALLSTLLAASLPWVIPRINSQVKSAREADLAAYYQQRLWLTVDRVGGAKPCLLIVTRRGPVPAGPGSC